MISWAERRYSYEEVLSRLDPTVAGWFSSNFSSLSPPQEYAVVPILEGKNVLVSSPTGTGKTLAAFLGIVSKLFSLASRGELEDRIYAVYVSPLRALNNDVYRNLEVPLRGIYQLARERGIEAQEIRHAVRTGDTPPSERQRQLRRPPHILITTPETLAIVLVAPKFRRHLEGVEWVIVDEIHSLVENKRGVHLSLSLERLEGLAGRSPVRIGLSATINPLEVVAEFLVGYENGRPRDCLIVDARYAKPLDLKVLCPVDDLVHTPSAVASQRMYELLADLVRRHRTTLIFTNTRSGTERVVFHLKELLNEGIEDLDADESIAAHHSSLSRHVRHDVEERLKRGELRAIVSSTSLELGIDIGYIDLVAQIGSPKSVTRALQRVGRAGHRLHEVSRGRFVVVDRDDAVEVAVMVREALSGHLDRARIPEKALDVLAQHLAGMAVERRWDAREAFELVRRAYPYRNLTWEEFESVLRYLSGGYSELETYKVYGKIWYDPGEGAFGRRGRYARVIYATNIGTIPDEVAARVYNVENNRYIGNLEEEFVERLSPGDRFVLAGRVYEFVKSKGLKVYVRPAFDQKPTVPSWFSEMLPLSYDLAVQVARFRARIAGEIEGGRDQGEIVAEIARECSTDEKAARAIFEYIREQLVFLRSLGLDEFPSDEVILVETYLAEDGNSYRVFHTLVGRRANDALSRALAYVVGRRIGRNLGVVVADNGFALVFPRGVEPQGLLSELDPNGLRATLRSALANTELLKRRFRHVAARGLMILRNYKGHEIRVSRQQASAETLLKAVSDIEGFPLLRETYREIMEDFMDVETAELVLRSLREGRAREVELPPLNVPSPFSHGIVLQGLSDVVLMEDRRAMLERFHRMVLELVEAGQRAGGG
ncbi:MAG: ATP-dependent helicase [Candidatus Korarchaeota archaeon]|nr:ATP-dependent helicase [Candidatus Korarchaeota archaeon]